MKYYHCLATTSDLSELAQVQVWLDLPPYGTVHTVCGITSNRDARVEPAYLHTHFTHEHVLQTNNRSGFYRCPTCALLHLSNQDKV